MGKRADYVIMDDVESSISIARELNKKLLEELKTPSQFLNAISKKGKPVDIGGYKCHLCGAFEKKLIHHYTKAHTIKKTTHIYRCGTVVDGNIVKTVGKSCISR